MPERPVRTVALYLPQFHPIPENDEWWGPGFTEWTNVTAARRRYPTHYQPHLPGELGFYDLRVPEARAAQARLAHEHGVDAFCYWHYWFGSGRRLLERPFAEVLASGEPDFPFCLGWANESWSGIWHGAPDRVLVEQIYPGDADFRAHFEAVLPAFRDPRYFRVDGRPLFYVFGPESLPDPDHFLALWREWAVAAGLPGIYFVGRVGGGRPTDADFDALVVEVAPRRALRRRDVMRRVGRALGVPPVHTYADFSRQVPQVVPGRTSFPCVLAGWDSTPRSGAGGVVLHGATAQVFGQQVDRAVQLAVRNEPDERVVFVKAWNEWAEGNHLEPDRRHGRAFLEALRDHTARVPSLP